MTSQIAASVHKLYAHLYRARGGGWQLVITPTPDTSYLTPAYNRFEMRVSGKREARKIATERGAICWNF